MSRAQPINFVYPNFLSQPTTIKKNRIETDRSLGFWIIHKVFLINNGNQSKTATRVRTSLVSPQSSLHDSKIHARRRALRP